MIYVYYMKSLFMISALTSIDSSQCIWYYLRIYFRTPCNMAIHHKILLSSCIEKQRLVTVPYICANGTINYTQSLFHRYTCTQQRDKWLERKRERER